MPYWRYAGVAVISEDQQKLNLLRDRRGSPGVMRVIEARSGASRRVRKSEDKGQMFPPCLKFPEPGHGLGRLNARHQRRMRSIHASRLSACSHDCRHNLLSLPEHRRAGRIHAGVYSWRVARSKRDGWRHACRAAMAARPPRKPLAGVPWVCTAQYGTLSRVPFTTSRADPMDHLCVPLHAGHVKVGWRAIGRLKLGKSMIMPVGRSGSVVEHLATTTELGEPLIWPLPLPLRTTHWYRLAIALAL